MLIPKEVKADFLKSLQFDYLKADCDLRWLRTQLVNPKFKDEESQDEIRKQIRQVEQTIKAFEDRIQIQNNLP